MKKYFFFDIDGTLRIGMGGPVPASTRACLDELRTRGHFVATATGRLQKDAARRVSGLGIISLVADGGWSLTLDGRILQMKSLPAASCTLFLQQLDRLGIPWAVTTKNELVRYTPDRRFLEQIDDGYFDTVILPGLSAASQHPIYKIFFPCTAQRLAQLELFGLSTVQYSAECVFIEPVDKANGILSMMKVLGAPASDVVVFGDGSNDLQMFRPQWLSIAMGNACAPLKEKADYVTTPCDQDGIYLACRHFGWVD